MHEQYLLAALQQARLGRGQCAPNPSVGAVAVQRGEIIAQAWHQGAGTPHAEQLLLAQFAPKTPGVTLYVTLEPCNHWGRTPPCVEAIIAHGIEHVVFAFLDPNPIVANNNTPEQLRSHGVQVTYFPVPEVTSFYESYRHWVCTGKPWVTVKMAQSFDGKIAGPHGVRYSLSNSLCEQFTHERRGQSDVILTSARTVFHDNPKMTARLDGIERGKTVAIIDSQLSLDTKAKVFSIARHCHIYHTCTPVRFNADCEYHLMPEKNGTMDLAAVIHHLGSLGYHDVWVEVGGTLFSALHRQRLVDRTYLYLVPTVLGESALSAYQQEGVLGMPHSISWHEKGNNMIVRMDWQEETCLQE